MSDSHRHGDDPVGRIVAIAVAMVLTGAVVAAWQLVADGGQQQHQPTNYEQGAASQLTAKGRVRSASGAPPGQPHQQKADQSVGPGTWPDWVIVGFTCALALLGGLQYRLDRRTARETSEALRIARETADAALRSADIAGRSLLAEQRPWLEIGNVLPVGPALWIAGETLKCTVAASFENIGRTPALDVRTLMLVEVMDTFDAGPRLESHIKWFRSQGGMHRALFPGSVHPESFDNEHRGGAAPVDQLCVYIFLLVAYGSAFGDERHCTGVARPIRVVKPDGTTGFFSPGDDVPANQVRLDGGWMNLTHAD